MNKEQKTFLFVIFLFGIGLICGFIETTKFWLLMYFLAVIIGYDIAIYFNKKEIIKI